MLLRTGVFVTFSLLMLSQSAARELTVSEKRIISEGVTRTFKDPSSAQFRWIAWPGGKGDEVVTYCGMVNAKNSYGAYTGFAPFVTAVVLKGGKITAAVPIGGGNPGSSGGQAALMMCEQRGLNPLAAR